MKLDIKAMAFAIAVVWGLSMLVIGLAPMYGYGGAMLVEVLSSLYKNYTPTMRGALIGAGWGFGEGLISGAVLAFVYNQCLPRK